MTKAGAVSEVSSFQMRELGQGLVFGARQYRQYQGASLWDTKGFRDPAFAIFLLQGGDRNRITTGSNEVADHHLSGHVLGPVRRSRHLSDLESRPKPQVGTEYVSCVFLADHTRDDVGTCVVTPVSGR